VAVGTEKPTSGESFTEKDDLTGVTTPLPTLVEPQGIALSDSEKAEALADTLEALFRRVNEPSESALVNMFDEAM
jgi:hypothetical protein